MLPTLIAVASLIPGLGFLILGRWKSALLTWVFLIPFTAFLFMTIQFPFECLALNVVFVLMVLIIQWTRAFKLAGIIEQLRQGETTLLNQVDVQSIQLDPRATLLQRQHAIFGKRLETHLLPGESLMEWIVGESRTQDTFWGNRSVCIGLLKDDLLMCEFGVFDYPETIKRLHRANLRIFSGSRNGKNLIWIIDETAIKGKKSTIFTIGSEYNELMKIFNEHTRAQPMFKG